MELDITGQLNKVVIGATGLPGIIQQVQIVCATQVGSLPLDRAFGVQADYLDMPLPVAKAKATASIIEGIDKHVPAVSVLAVNWVEDTQAATGGKLIPLVRVKINGI